MLNYIKEILNFVSICIVFYGSIMVVSKKISDPLMKKKYRSKNPTLTIEEIEKQIQIDYNNGLPLISKLKNKAIYSYIGLIILVLDVINSIFIIFIQNSMFSFTISISNITNSCLTVVYVIWIIMLVKHLKHIKKNGLTTSST